MDVVKQRVFNLGRFQHAGKLRLPDALSEPRSRGRSSEAPLDVFAHAANLFLLVLRRNGNEDGLVKAAANDFYLAAPGQRTESFEEFRVMRFQPFHQRPGIVKSDADGGVPRQVFDKWRIRLLKDPLDHRFEVPGRLMSVNEKCQVKFFQESAPPVGDVTADRGSSSPAPREMHSAADRIHGTASARPALVLCRDFKGKSKPASRAKAAPHEKVESTAKNDAPRRDKDAELFDHGVALFNSRRFFEAHEAWEEVWLHTERPEKTFLQGLIQVAAAFHHHTRGNLRGMESLLHRGLTKLDGFPASHRGLQIGALRASARVWLTALHSKDMARSPRVPVLKAQK